MTEKELIPGTVVRHFKREMLTEKERAESTQYLYEILGVAITPRPERNWWSTAPCTARGKSAHVRWRCSSP